MFRFRPQPTGPTRSTPFQQPRTFLTFSYDDDHTLKFDDSSMKYFKDPPRRANLSYGYESWIKREEERPRIDTLLKCLMRPEAQRYAWRSNIVTWRGVLTKIMTSPYEAREGWSLNAMLLNGNIYIEEHLTDADLDQKSEMNPHHRLMSYYGYAFESYCTTSSPGHVEQSPDAPVGWGGGPVNTNSQWCHVVKTKLGSSRLILGGEVDAVRGQFDGTTSNLVELKTSMSIRPNNHGDRAKFNRKVLKFFAQSFLLGVPEIIVGFRSAEGTIDLVRSYPTLDLPAMASQNANGADVWDANFCLEFADGFMSYLRQVLEEGEQRSNNLVWRITMEPRVGIRLSELSDVEEVRNGEDRVGFLPTWFIQSQNSNSDV